MLVIAAVVIIVLALAAFVCIPRNHERYDPTVELFTASGSPNVFHVEIADTHEKQATGLMNRNYLADDGGMLFVFSNDETRYFWMENTLIPLDMVFISSDLKVIDIHENATPLSRDIIQSALPCKFVLEVNGGACRDQNIAVGDSVRLELSR